MRAEAVNAASRPEEPMGLNAYPVATSHNPLIYWYVARRPIRDFHPSAKVARILSQSRSMGARWNHFTISGAWEREGLRSASRGTLDPGAVDGRVPWIATPPLIHSAPRRA